MRPNKLTLAFASAALAGLLAACSSAATSSGSPATNSGSPAGSASGQSAAQLSNLLQANPPTFKGPTAPAKAPAGIKLGIISCSQQLQGCVDVAAGAAKAASSAGWVSRTFDGQAQTTTENAQLAAATTWGAKVILLIAIDPVTVQSGLRTAHNAGAIIVAAANGGSPPNPTTAPPAGAVWPSVDVSPSYQTVGELKAKWIIANSGGKAHVLVYGDREYPVVDLKVSSFVNAMTACKACVVSPVQYFTATQIATSLGPDTVNYLRQHPDINYIAAPYDPTVPAMVAAIKSAGMANRVKIVSDLGNQQNLQYVKNQDVQLADVAVDDTYNGYAAVDQAIRLVNHQPLAVPNNENVPVQLLDPTNIGSFASKSNGWVAPYDYASEYQKLWK